MLGFFLTCLLCIAETALAAFVVIFGWRERAARLLALLIADCVLGSVALLALHRPDAAVSSYAMLSVLVLAFALYVALMLCLLSALFAPEWWRGARPIRWIMAPYLAIIIAVALDLLLGGRLTVSGVSWNGEMFRFIPGAPLGTGAILLLLGSELLHFALLLKTLVARPALRRPASLLLLACGVSLAVSLVQGSAASIALSTLVQNVVLLASFSYVVLGTRLIVPTRLTLHTVLDALSDAALILARDGAILYANPSARALGLWPGERLPPALDALRASGSAGPAPLSLAGREVEWSFASLERAHGRWGGEFVLGRDVGARNAAAAQLRESDQLVEALFEHAPVAIQIYDANGVAMRMNEAQRRLLGPSDTNHDIGTFNVLSDPWMAALGDDVFFRRAYEGESVHLPLRSIELSSDGVPPGATRRVWLDQRVFPLRNEAGAVYAVVSLSEDLTAQQEAAQQLARTTHLLEELFAHAPIGLQIFDRNGTSTRMNEANRRILGLPDITAGVGTYNILTDPYAHAYGSADAFRRASAGEVVQLLAQKIDLGAADPAWNTSGRVLFVDYMMFPLRDARGEVDALVSCMLDITARVCAEDEVRRLNRELENLVALRTAQLRSAVASLEEEVAQRRLAERRYRTLVDHFPNGFVCLFDYDLRFIIAGGAALAALGMSSEYVEGKTLWELGLPPELVRTAEPVYRAALAGEIMELEETVNGRALTGQALPVTDDQGTVIAGMVVVWDVSERRAAEAAQRASEALFRDVWESAVDAMALVDPNGLYLLTNPAHQRLYGYPPGSAIGQPFTMVIPEERRESTLSDFRMDFHTCHPLQRGEFVAQRVDGTPLEIEVQMNFIVRDGQRIARLLIARDISARKLAAEARIALERKLLETQKLESLGVLAGGIAHDFNNLLTGTLGHAELALLDVAPHSEVSDHIQGVISGVRNTAELTRQLLAYAGRGRFVVQPLQLNTVIREMSDLLRVSVAKHCTLRYELADPLPPINADGAQIRQVVLNLLVNASEAIPVEGGTITLSTALEHLTHNALEAISGGAGLAEGPYVRLSVSDTGAGMDEATQARIFDPFFSTKLTGRGLGLAAVRGIVRSHLGALRVSSKVAAGTTFDLWFPATSTTPELAAAPPATLAPQASTVLVIDDEAPVRDIARRMLERLGYRVLLAASGQEALALLRGGIPNLAAVLVDLLMPEMKGDEVARLVHALLPNTPVLLMSGYSAETIVEEFAAMRLTGVIQKPFTINTLRATLHAALPHPS